MDHTIRASFLMDRQHSALRKMHLIPYRLPQCNTISSETTGLRKGRHLSPNFYLLLRELNTMTALVRSFMSLGEVITRHLVFRRNILQVIVDQITLFLPAAFFPIANHCDGRYNFGAARSSVHERAGEKWRKRAKYESTPLCRSPPLAAYGLVTS